MKKLFLLIFMGFSLVFYADSHEEHMIDDCYDCYITKNNSVYLPTFLFPHFVYMSLILESQNYILYSPKWDIH